MWSTIPSSKHSGARMRSSTRVAWFRRASVRVRVRACAAVFAETFIPLRGKRRGGFAWIVVVVVVVVGSSGRLASPYGRFRAFVVDGETWLILPVAYACLKD